MPEKKAWERAEEDKREGKREARLRDARKRHVPDRPGKQRRRAATPHNRPTGFRRS